MRITSDTIADGIRERLFTVGEVMVTEIVPDWQATLDAPQKLDYAGDSQPAGYYGLSPGGGMGVHLVTAEPRITAAVLGLDKSDVLVSAAPRITIPVE